MSEYLTERELAERYGLRSDTIKRWRKNGKGPAYHVIGGSVRYRKSDIEAYERARRTEPAE